jgi:hypothetical protein
MEDPIGEDCTRPRLYLYLPYLQDLILQLSSKPPQLWAFWPVPSGGVGRLLVGPLILSTESRRRGTLGIHPCTQVLGKRAWII